MSEIIKVLVHSSVKISGDRIIYFDPFKIDSKYYDADYIFITHDHYDHYSEEDIDKIKKNTTIFIVPEMLVTKLLIKGIPADNIIPVIPNREYEGPDFEFETVPAYNKNKQFHPKENGWVGYIISLNNVRYYIAGDTDITEENKKVKCDVALVPIGGTYTMNAIEAAELVNIINPKIAIPIHYGDIVGSKEDEKVFLKLLKPSIEGKILIGIK